MQIDFFLLCGCLIKSLQILAHGEGRGRYIFWAVGFKPLKANQYQCWHIWGWLIGGGSMCFYVCFALFSETGNLVYLVYFLNATQNC